ncbi:uncharacterized protein LOC123536004 [Mercenaria mercenaria]|uniref:uncharacterized protein LOC123536004 n=1 Tax=Mercenaria mercenaria TaxID=6596 RepID=UPI00234F6E7D|nr:uncharacterized protein LOC123536004 [Mercenaria mercenaria]
MISRRISAALLVLAIVVAAANGRAFGNCEDYCLPGARCWPTHEDIVQFNESTKGRANKRVRVVVGGSSHTVTIGGYTQGGGHSPIGRKFGLGVDNLLDVELVSANGSLAHADKDGTTVTDTVTGLQSHSSNPDIFWAVRGGGGSTFGIITSLTFKLHFDSKMVMILCSTPIFDEQGRNIGQNFMDSFNQLLTTSLAPEWGGYELIRVNQGETQGNVILFLNHYGEWGSPSFNTISPVLPTFSQHCLFYNVSNFLEYAVNANDSLYYRTYIFNRLLQRDSFTPRFYNYLFNMVTDPNRKSFLLCTGVLVGGNINHVSSDETPMNPSFRTAFVSMTCALSWHDPSRDEEMISHAENVTKGFLQFGKGIFFNEPSVYQPDWKTAYWGVHYGRLLAIKREWDPDNILTCHHCVGSDLVKGANFYDNPLSSNGLPIVG